MYFSDFISGIDITALFSGISSLNPVRFSIDKKGYINESNVNIYKSTTADGKTYTSNINVTLTLNNPGEDVETVLTSDADE